MTRDRRPRQRDRRRHQPRVAADERDVGRLDGHVRAGADGDADVGLGERRGVVDAVADHRHRRGPRPGAAATRRVLVGRQHLGDDAVRRDADLRAATASAVAARVAGEQPDVDAGRAQLAATASADLGLTGSAMASDAGGRAVDRDADRRSRPSAASRSRAGRRAPRGRRRARSSSRRLPTSTVAAVDRAGDAAPGDRLEPVDRPEAELVLARPARRSPRRAGARCRVSSDAARSQQLALGVEARRRHDARDRRAGRA